MKLLVLTGMSGAGKTTAIKIFEDMDYYCVDNLPVELLRNFMELGVRSGSEDKNIVVGIDIRSGESLELLSDIFIDFDKIGYSYKILFLDSSDEALVKRYKETRRNHPLSGSGSIADGIIEERRRLAFLRDKAEYIIDTSNLLTRELKEELTKIFLEDVDYKNLFVTVMSFGFKYGIPADADMVLDVRFLPNPYYDISLRVHTGNDKEIKDFVMAYEETHVFLEKTTDLINFLIPSYIKEGKNRFVLAIGCTGGKHRSVCLANALYDELLKDSSIGVRLEHRDISKDALRGK